MFKFASGCQQLLHYLYLVFKQRQYFLEAWVVSADFFFIHSQLTKNIQYLCVYVHFAHNREHKKADKTLYDKDYTQAQAEGRALGTQAPALFPE